MSDEPAHKNVSSRYKTRRRSRAVRYACSTRNVYASADATGVQVAWAVCTNMGSTKRALALLLLFMIAGEVDDNDPSPFVVLSRMESTGKTAAYSSQWHLACIDISQDSLVASITSPT